MPRPEKVAVVDEIREKLEGSLAAVLTEYRGLTVSELADLRAALRSADAEYKVFKNTLARRAAEEAGLDDLISLLQGPTAITFVRGDTVMVAKALRDYARTNPNLVVKGGVLGTRVIRPDDVVALADIQPREVLLARIAGGFQAPLVKAAGLFQAFTRNMAYGLKALIDQRVAGGEAAPPDDAAAEAPAPDTAEAPEAPAAETPAAEAPEAPAAEAPPPPPPEAAPDLIDEAPTAAAVDGPAGTGDAPADVAAAETEPSAEEPPSEAASAEPDSSENPPVA